MNAGPIGIFQSPNIIRDIQQLPEFKMIASQFRDDLGHKIVEAKKDMKMNNRKLTGFLVSPHYYGMLLTFCYDMIDKPVKHNEKPLMYGLPIIEDEVVSTIAFSFE